MAQQAAQKEAADARKKKKTEVAHRKYKKEKEVARRMKARERKSDVESELESEDPMDVDDMVFSEEEESPEVVLTSAERRNPAATSAGDEQEVEKHVKVPMLRKCAASADTVSEWEAKWTQSSRPSSASLALSPPAADATGQARRSKEPAHTRASLGPVPMCDPQ